MPFDKARENLALLETLFQLRIGAGLTQQELAARLDIPQSTVSKIESGLRKVDLVELKAICEATGVSLVDFVHQFETNTLEKEH